MEQQNFDISRIKAIIGLGNPGTRFELTRHNIGFLLLDMLADRYNGNFSQKKKAEVTEIQVTSGDIYQKLILIKPQTFMNNSGEVLPDLKKQGIEPHEILVVHDELEKKFGYLGIRLGGSARGHNGLRSIIQYIGHDFWRLRMGVDRPADKSQVSNYVLEKFKPSELDQLQGLIEEGIELLGL